MKRARISDNTDSDTKSVRRGNYFLDDKPIDFVSSGCTLLDCVLGGGWALGRIVNLVGDKSTGKTLLAIEAIINFLNKFPDGRVTYHETEHAFDKEYAKALSMPVDRIDFIEDVNSIDGLFVSLGKFLNASVKGVPGLYILDSLDALSDGESKDSKSVDSATPGYGGAKKAAKLSVLLSKAAGVINKTNVLFMVISQVRDNIGVMFGERHRRAGGKSLDFYTSQVLWLSEKSKATKTVKGVKRVVGLDIRAKCKKNKVSLPWRECDIPILFGYGVDDVVANLRWLDSVCDINTEFDMPTVKRKRGSTTVEERVPVEVFAEMVKSGNVSNPKRVRRRIASVTKKYWRLVETEFVPKYSKY